MNNKRNGLFRIFSILIPLLILFFIFFGSITNYLIDYQWFKELNYTEVFFKKLFTQIKFFIPSFIGLFAVFYLYMKSINAHSMKNSGILLSNDEKKGRNKIMILISFLSALLFSIAFVASIWYDFLIFINSTLFNVQDPIFSKDIGFYIFSLPFFDKLYGFMLALIFILGLISVIFNAMAFINAKTSTAEPYQDNISSIHRPRDMYKNVLSAASKQLAVLGALLFIVLAFGFYLRVFGLLYSSRGVAYGASYTDIKVNLPFYYIYIAVCLFTAVMILISSFRKKMRLAVFGPILLVIATIASGVVATGVQNIIVNPNELSKEEPYLQNNIDYTNIAYGLDKVKVSQFNVAQDLVRKDIENNRTTISNIPINDYKPAKDIYNQIQGLKNYYTFNDIDIDRYMINGVYRQVFVSARELKEENIPKQSGAASASWINRYLKYTHGYGIAMSPVNEVTPSGQPRLFIKDMPLVSDINVKVDRPQIYFGENTEDFVIVNTREKEFDYPTSNQNIETVYEGKGGIKLGLLNRILFAVRYGNLNFLLSQDINSESRVLINRDVEKRVEKAAPFLVYDDDPYVVTVEGKLYWIIDAFTISSRYPYSEPINDSTTTNYIRNSVKVVVDAYDGTIDYYISDMNDPLAITYSKIFKTLFKPLDKMPEELKAHIRYPQTLFDIQANIYKKYHMKTARELYNKSDIWDIATQIYGTSNTESQPVESTYLIMRLPENQKEEFLLMVPYTPQSKTNMNSWLAVKNDGNDYGEMILYRFPSGKIIEGPMQVEGIVSQDVAIVNTLNLLQTGGNSQVIRGNMMVIPVEDSILYVEPIYVRSSNATALPELKRVIVFYKNQVVMEETLEKSLARIFPGGKTDEGQKPVEPEQPGTIQNDTVENLIARANAVFNEAQNALKAGNWQEYGSKQNELERILKQLNTMAGGQQNQANPEQAPKAPEAQQPPVTQQ